MFSDDLYNIQTKILKAREERRVLRSGVKDGAVSKERVQSIYLGT